MFSTHHAEQCSASRSRLGSIPELRAALRGEVVAPAIPTTTSSARCQAAVDRAPR